MIDKRIDINNMIEILNKVDIIYLFGGDPLLQLEIIKRINYEGIFKNKIYYINNYFVVKDGKIEERKGDDLYEEHRNSRIRIK